MHDESQWINLRQSSLTGEFEGFAVKEGSDGTLYSTPVKFIPEQPHHSHEKEKNTINDSENLKNEPLVFSEMPNSASIEETIKIAENRQDSTLSSDRGSSLIMNPKPYSEWKHDLLQILGTAVAIVALVLPLLMWGIDRSFDSIRTEIREADRRYELRQSESEKRLEQWQQMTKELIDAKTANKSS